MKDCINKLIPSQEIAYLLRKKEAIGACERCQSVRVSLVYAVLPNSKSPWLNTKAYFLFLLYILPRLTWASAQGLRHAFMIAVVGFFWAHSFPIPSHYIDQSRSCPHDSLQREQGSVILWCIWKKESEYLWKNINGYRTGSPMYCVWGNWRVWSNNKRIYRPQAEERWKNREQRFLSVCLCVYTCVVLFANVNEWGKLSALKYWIRPSKGNKYKPLLQT